MEVGAMLEDVRGHEPRFRVEELLHQGKSYQLVLGADTHMDDKTVCIKAIDYDTEHLSDPDYVSGRRRALKDELEFLALPSHLLPEPLDWLVVDGSPTGNGAEPLLVYEHQHGSTLYDLITQRHPMGLEPRRALRMFSELVGFCAEIHASGWVFRDFDPRHIIVGLDDIIHVVGGGNAVRRGEKMNVFKMSTSPHYTAPEIRRELSGKVVRPACDFYSLGCLLSFMLTGIEPQPVAEAPLDPDAYDWLREEAEPGYKLLIARCLQPLAQKRFSTASKLLPYCTPETLPEPTDGDFGMMMLPTPWLGGPEGADNRALRSRLSPGPLLSEKQRARREKARAAEAQAEADASASTHTSPAQPHDLPTTAPETSPAKEEEGTRKIWVGVLAAGGVFLVLCIIAIIVSVAAFALGWV